MPVVGHRPGDDAAGVVGISHTGDGCQQTSPHFRRGVIDGGQSLRPVVEASHQRLADVVELQALNAAQAVGAIAASDAIGHRPGAVAVVHHVVVCSIAGELSGVVVEGTVTRDDFASDHQLAGGVAADEHVMHQFGHAEGPVDFRPGAVGVLTHADVDGHGPVAIDQVVTAAPCENIAAAAAEDDVTGAERGDACSQELLQPGDQADVGQDATGESRGGDGRRIAVVALEDVAVGRAGQAFHELEAGQQRRGRRGYRGLVEGPQVELDVDPQRIVTEHRPVEAGAADVAIALAAIAEHDVVAALTVHAVDDAFLTDVHIVAGNVVEAELVEVVTGVAVGAAQFQPVVAFVTELRLVGPVAEDEVVADTAEDLRGVLARNDEVVAEATEDQVEAVAAMDDVVAVIALDVIVAATVSDDVVTEAATDLVVAVATFQAVIAGIAPERIVAEAGNHDVIAVGPAQHHVLVAGVAQVVAVVFDIERRRGIVDGHRIDTNHPRHQGAAANRVLARRGEIVGALIHSYSRGVIAENAISPRVNHVRIELPADVHLQDQAGVGEDIRRQVGGIGIGHHHLGEGVVFQLGEEVHARRAFEVVEAVAVLEFLHLVLEHEVEGRAQQATERHLPFGQATDPQVDVVDPGDSRIAVEEGQAIRRSPVPTKDQGEGGVAFLGQGGGSGDAGVGAVGRDEVDDGRLVLQVGGEVHPTGVRPQLAVAGGVVEVLARRVERGHTGITAAGEVDGGQVQRQPEEVVAQRLGDELIDFIAGLAGHATDDIAGRLRRRQGAIIVEGQRIEEGVDQAHAARVLEVRIQPVDRLGEHGVTEAIHHMGELRDDRRVDRRVIDLGGVEEHVHLRLHLAGELLEHQVLVLHLRGEAGGLEQPLAVPYTG
ncbi:hypothetical protein D9M71_170530 [compost metagenome]